MFSSALFMIFQLVVTIFEKNQNLTSIFENEKKIDFFSNLDTFFFLNHLVKKLRYFPIK